MTCYGFHFTSFVFSLALIFKIFKVHLTFGILTLNCTLFLFYLNAWVTKNNNLYSFHEIPKCRIFGIDRTDADSSSLHARKGPLAPEFSNSIFLDWDVIWLDPKIKTDKSCLFASFSLTLLIYFNCKKTPSRGFYGQ